MEISNLDEALVLEIATLLDAASLASLECVSRSFRSVVAPVWDLLASHQIASYDNIDTQLSAKDRIIRRVIAERHGSRWEQQHRSHHYFRLFPSNASMTQEELALSHHRCRGCTEMPDLDLYPDPHSDFYLRFSYGDRVVFTNFVRAPAELSGRMLFLPMDEQSLLKEEESNSRWPELKNLLQWRNKSTTGGELDYQTISLIKACFSGLTVTVVRMPRDQSGAPVLVMCTRGRPDAARAMWRGQEIFEISLNARGIGGHEPDLDQRLVQQIQETAQAQLNDNPFALFAENCPQDPHFDVKMSFEVADDQPMHLWNNGSPRFGIRIQRYFRF